MVAATLLDMKVAGLLPQGEARGCRVRRAARGARPAVRAALLQYRAFKEVVGVVRALPPPRGRAPLRARCGLEEKYRQRRCPSWCGRSAPDDFAALALLAMTPKEIPHVGLDHLHAPLVSIREQAGDRGDAAAAMRGPCRSAEPHRGRRAVRVSSWRRFLSVLELYRHAALSFEQLEPLGELTLRWTAQRWSDENPRYPGSRL